MVTKATATLDSISFGAGDMPRAIRMMMATEVRDVHGNWVRYDYDGDDRLTAIRANDGRRINFGYAGTDGLIRTVTSNPGTADARTWSYSYRTGTYSTSTEGDRRTRPDALSEVALPDGLRRWTYDLINMSSTSNAIGDACSDYVDIIGVGHPDGVAGTFDLREFRHRKGGGAYTYPSKKCNTTEGSGFPGKPMASDYTVSWYGAIGVARKQLTWAEDGAPRTSEWRYEYERDGSYINPLNDCTRYPDATDWNGDGEPPATNWTVVTQPDGSKRKYWHYWTSPICGTTPFGGRMARADVLNADGSLVESTSYRYVQENGNGTYSLPFSAVSSTTTRPTHAYETKVVRGSDYFATRYTYQLSKSSSAYSYGRPVQVEEWSNTSGGLTARRVSKTSYERRLNTGVDAKASVFALPNQTRRGDAGSTKLFDDFDYDDRGRITKHRKFGNLVADVTWHGSGAEAGRLHTITDALGRQTQYGSYKRGIPQSVRRADGKSVSRSVDLDGRVTAWSDAIDRAGTAETTVRYRYDANGWLTSIDRPGRWSDTSLAYAGHGQGLVQTITEGALETRVTYDAMLRTTEHRQRAVQRGGGTIYTETAYDPMGRVAFSSWPSSAAGATKGTYTAYDGLGRPTYVRDRASATGAVYASTVNRYWSGNRHVVDDAEGNRTETERLGWGSPDDGVIAKIIQRQGTSKILATTEMAYDDWGNLISATQSGPDGVSSSGTVSQTQRWHYDPWLRLCRHHAPETGSSLYRYDAAGQMTQEAKGQGGWAADCGSMPAAKIVRSYTPLGQLDYVNYTDGTPDVDYQYDANGNLYALNSASGANWYYRYHYAGDRDLLREQTLVIDGRTYRTEHGYKTDGALSWTTYPSDVRIDAYPDGHGRQTAARKAGGKWYGRYGAYHPNGMLSGLTYGNGVLFRQSLNERQLPLSRHVHHGGTNVSYLRYAGYDANGRITDLDDYTDRNRDRTFGYDGLGRLTTATGPWGSGSYRYDALGNLRRKTLGGKRMNLAYAPDNRLATAKGSFQSGSTPSAGWAYGYDERGNTTGDGRNTFYYDLSDRPTSYTAPGGGGGAMRYDGHGRRVKQTRSSGAVIYSVYALDGTLLHRDDRATDERTDYVRMGPELVAKLRNGAPTYVHNDHLGSPVAETDGAREVSCRGLYTPYGEEIGTTLCWDDDAGFTGHVKDEDTALTYMQARYYDPVTGRFGSNDPVGFGAGKVGYFGRYHYAANDPVNLYDPNGESPEAIARGTLTWIALDAATPEPTDAAWPKWAGYAVAGAVAGGFLILTNDNDDGSLTTPDGNKVRNHGKKGTAGEYLDGKGHTPESVDEILGDPDSSYPAANGDTSTGGKVGATVNVKGGDFAVTNDKTGEVIAVNDRNNPRQEPPRPREDQ